MKTVSRGERFAREFQPSKWPLGWIGLGLGVIGLFTWASVLSFQIARGLDAAGKQLDKIRAEVAAELNK